MKKILFIYGTRLEAIKVASLIKKFKMLFILKFNISYCLYFSNAFIKKIMQWHKKSFGVQL